MGKLDTEAKNYMSRNDRFADAFNYLIYDGRQVIKPDELVEMDVTELAIPFLDEKRAPVQKIRDILKSRKKAEGSLSGSAEFLSGFGKNNRQRYGKSYK